MSTPLQKITIYLKENQQTITCAESCTGGLLSSLLTSLPGSSVWFHQSFITYSNEAKEQTLGVNPNTLLKYGAVSKETVHEMAKGAKIKANADYSLSISGIAGPDGGSIKKPVGTIWFGLSTPTVSIEHMVLFKGNRDSIRMQAVEFAFNFLLTHLEQ